ncbi:MAG: LysR family transcriptional regulator [Fretibacterium sp.]|nr:LysR family transcriptional regulator [Fretibacterium sp.]
MNTEFLRSFLDVVETGSFTKSAHRLHVSQSTISSRIRELERETGQKLFFRLRDRAEPTAAGRALVTYAEKILSTEARALEHLSVLGEYPDRLVVGCVHAFYECFPEELHRFRKALPRTAFRLVLKHSHEIVDRILGGDFDVGYTHHPCNREGYACDLLYRDTMLLVTRGSNRRHRKGVLLQEVPGLPILYSSFLDTHIVKRLFGRLPSFELDIDIGSKIIPYVLNEDKYTFLPQRLAGEHLDSGSLAVVPLLDFELPPLEYFVLYSLRHPYADILQGQRFSHRSTREPQGRRPLSFPPPQRDGHPGM